MCNKTQHSGCVKRLVLRERWLSSADQRRGFARLATSIWLKCATSGTAASGIPSIEARRRRRSRVPIYGVDVIRRAMSDFREELKHRDEPFGDGLVHLYGQLEGALTRLTGFFEGSDEDGELARMLVVFVADRIEELASRARELDEDYAVHPKPDSAPGAARKRTMRGVRK